VIRQRLTRNERRIRLKKREPIKLLTHRGTELLFLLLPLFGHAQTATINGGTTYQTIDGFGGENGGPFNWASAPFDWNNLSGSSADALFSASAGIGISIYRTSNVDGTSSTLPPDMTAMESAYQRGARIELTLSSPPSSMKYGGAFWNGSAGASGSCVSASYSTYATYVVQLIQNIQSSGSLTITWIDVANEPNNTGGSGPNNGQGACGWSASALDSFVQVLGPALSSAGLSTQIILGEAYDYANASNYFGTCINDSACKSYVSVVAGHGYGYPDSPVAPGSGGYPSLSSGYHIWQGETSDNGATNFNSGMLDSGGATGALTMAENMHNFLVTGQVSSYNWWELGYINNGGTCQNCQLVDQNFDFTKRYYAFGNFSKFVRPGMVMIGATTNPQAGVYVSAYLNQSNSFAIVVVNANSSSVSQTFNLSGLSAGSVTPYITDNNNNLASQTSVPIYEGSFTSTLTPSSVTTFVATGNGPEAPSHLTATVRQ